MEKLSNVHQLIIFLNVGIGALADFNRLIKKEVCMMVILSEIKLNFRLNKIS